MSRRREGPRLITRARKGCSPAYYARWTVKGEDGGTRYVHLSLGSDADEADAEWEKIRNGGPPERKPKPEPAPEPRVLSVASFYRVWLRAYVRQRRTARQHQQARQRFRKYVLRSLGTKPLAALKSLDIFGWDGDMKAAGIGLALRHRIKEDLRCMLGQAVKAGAIDRSPWEKGSAGHMHRIPKQAPDRLSDLELAAVLQAAPEGPWRSLLGLMAHTGLRWGEALAIEWKDVHARPLPYLMIDKSINGPTKSGKERKVWLSPEAQQVLAALKRGPGRIFTFRTEDPSWITRYVKRHCWVKGFTRTRCAIPSRAVGSRRARASAGYRRCSVTLRSR